MLENGRKKREKNGRKDAERLVCRNFGKKMKY